MKQKNWYFALNPAFWLCIKKTLIRNIAYNLKKV